MLYWVTAAVADSPLNVYVVNYPLKYFAGRIGGDHVQVTLPVPAGVDPAYWTPSITDIGRYQQADLILLNGAGYAKWVQNVSLSRSKTVDTSQAFKDRYITSKEVTTHSHGAKGEHAHEALAFTTWLDFDLAAGQAEAVCQALVRKLPDRKGQLEASCASLISELKELDKDLKKMVVAAPQQPLVMSHPVYDYLAARYGLTIANLHWEPDQIIGQEQIVELETLLKTHPAQWMVWEAKPAPGSVERLEAIGIKSLVFDPCGNVPEQGDFMQVMQQNVKNMKKAFNPI
jgi:zinc transport system substrate-binding protein